MPSPRCLVRASAVAAVLGQVDAFWRLPCRGRSGLGLVDPIMNYGEPSDHAHTIHGSSNFGLEATNADMMQGNCTSCGVTEDMSTYWTPPMYFMYANGTSVMLEQVGGMLAYYLQQGDDLVEFPQGFQVIAGDATRRNFTCKTPEPPKSLWSGDEVTQDALEQKALGFNCLNYATTPEASLARHGLPSKSFIDNNCPDGLRLELFFPSCWNGKDATSPNHKSHMAYPSLVNGGDCPPGFPKRTASLFYETIWNTAAFKGVDGQFTLSQGDLTGYGYHGDFMTGWQTGHLQNALDTCTNPSGEVSDCPLFTLNTEDQMNQCTFPSPPSNAEPDCQGPMQGLPGNCELSNGPEAAIPQKGSSPPASHPSKPSAPQTSSSTPSATSHAVPTSVPSSYVAATRSPEASSSISTDPQSAAASRTGSTTGDLVFAEAVATPTASPSSIPSASSASSAPSAPSSAPQEASSPTPSSEPPQPSIQPQVSAAAAGVCNDSTKIVSGAAEYDICITDVTEYVTATGAPAGELHRRHLHEHVQHRRAGHGHHF